MKLFCRCIEPWLHHPVTAGDFGKNETRQILSMVPCPNCCSTGHYWYNADYENMMFDLKRMNQC